MLAQLQLKYGPESLRKYNETMKKVRSFFEGEGVVLLHGAVTRVGPLYEVWNLWRIEDQGHIARAFGNAGSYPHLSSVNGELAEVVESETVRFLESLPFSE